MNPHGTSLSKVSVGSHPIASVTIDSASSVDSVKTPLGSPLQTDYAEPSYDDTIEETREILDVVTEHGDDATKILLHSAFKHEEIGRLHGFAKVFLGLSIVALLIAPLLSSHPTAKLIYIAACIGEIITFSGLVWITRSLRHYLRKTATVLVMLSLLFVAPVTYFFGTYSSFAGLIMVSIYIHGMGSQRLSFAGYIFLAVPYGIIALLTTFAILPDWGVIRADYLTLTEGLTLQACLQLCFFASFMLARKTRQKLAVALDRLERATREVTKRELLLEEAKQQIADLVGGPGPYTNQIVGQFRLGVIIGRGAMGIIYNARSIKEGTPAAVKLLHKAAGAEALARFMREARLASLATSPHIVKVLHVSDARSKPAYIAMERLVGEDLSILLREKGTLSLKETENLLRDVAKGLSVAHKVGIVHRDLKPPNLFRARNRDGSHLWKILDFGISKMVSDATTLTGASILGTPSYMSPEQVSGGRVDHRSDQYSLAVLAYRCITGHSAFARENIPNVLYEVIHRMPAKPSSLVPLDEDVDVFFAIALCKWPEYRFTSATTMVHAFSQALVGQLSAGLRDKATRILVKHPWTTKITRQRRPKKQPVKPS